MKKRGLVLSVIIVMLLFLFIPFSLAAKADNEIIYRIPVKGEINPGLFHFIKSGIEKAENNKADAIILEIDTFGGLVDSAIKIRDEIFSSEIPVITYVSGRAWSAGALITLAGERVIMKRTSSIGAAETRPKEEKYISALRKEFGATAEYRGKNPDIAEAMVDADISLDGIIHKGKLLTLTAQEAKKYGIADFLVDNFTGVLSQLNYLKAKVINVEETSWDKLARFVTKPTVSGILLTLGFVALIFEALAPGFGLGGTVGLIAFGLFFSGYIINGVASSGLILLFIAGIILLLLEVLVIPGFGVAGIGGIAAIATSLYFFFPTPDIAFRVLAMVIISSILGTIIIAKIFGTSRLWKNISLGESQTKESGYTAHSSRQDLLGKRGETITPLRPAGIALVNGQRLDVVSEGGFIDKKKEVEVSKVAGSRIVVKKVKDIK